MMMISIVIIMTWCVVSFMDLIFKTCLFFPYLKTLDNTGLDISPFKVSWSSSHIPRGLLNAVQKRPKFYRMWFDIGALLACIFMMPSAILYFYSMSQVSFHGNTNTNSTILLVPMIPGKALPLSDWIILFFVAVFCSIFHECGHAIAAKRERVNVESYGFGVLVVFPWAFTTLNREQLMSLSDWQKLRIYAAGVWHNVVLSIIAAALLISSPYFLLPFYSYGQGVTVLRAEESINGSTAGLKAGDQIFAINDCSVTDTASWEKCLTLISMNKQRGYCVPRSFISHKNIAEKSTKHHDCCGSSNMRHVCFQYSDEMIEKEACLPGRDAIVNLHFCDFNSNCEKQSLCLVPLSSKVSDRFFEIHRNRNDSVLFVGLVEELNAYVKVANAVARSKLIPVTFADVFEKFLIYILYFSSGYACLNLLPCPFFDGESISEIVLFNVIYSFLCATCTGVNLEHRKLLTCIRRFHLIFAILMFLALIPNLSRYLNFLT